MQHLYQEEPLPQSEPLLLTITQVMEMLQLGRSTIYRLIDCEGLPVQRFGRALRFQREAIQKWLDDRRSQGIL